MPTPGLLALMEQCETRWASPDAHAGRAAERLRRIAGVLAQRLGIHCEAYVDLMCDGCTAHEWRALFPAEA